MNKINSKIPIEFSQKKDHEFIDLEENSEFLIINSDIPISSEKESYICKYLFAGICMFVFIGGSVSYLIFGIKFLIDNFNDSHNCNRSFLWEYVLLGIIFKISNLILYNISTSKNSSGDVNPILLFSLGFCSLALAIWGGFELWSSSCSDLKKTDLWVFALITFIFQMIEFFTLIIFPPIIIYGIKCWLNSDNFSISDISNR